MALSGNEQGYATGGRGVSCSAWLLSHENYSGRKLWRMMRRFCPGEMSISRIAVHAYDRGYKKRGLFVSWSDTMWTPSLFLTWCLTEGGCHQAGDKT